MRYMKCYDCWRVYREDHPTTHPEFNGCKCVCIRFKEKPDTLWVRIKAWLTNYL